jgi:hypothetical protein
MHHNVPIGRRVGERGGTCEQDESIVNRVRDFPMAVKILELQSEMITRRSYVRLILDNDVGIFGLPRGWRGCLFRVRLRGL